MANEQSPAVVVMKKVSVGAPTAAGLLLCVVVAVCVGAKGHGPEGKEMMTDRNILSVLERHTKELMAIPGVTGVAEGRCQGRPCIKVYVTEKAQSGGKIPAEIEGFPVSVEKTGEFRPLPGKGN
jgi:hypothetical protein